MNIGKARGIEYAGVLLLFLFVSIGMTWPLTINAVGNVILSKYYWDAFTNTAIMGAHVQNLLRDGISGLYINYFFAPIPYSIAFNENLLGLSLIYAPIYLLTHEPILSYNCVLIISLTLSGFFTYVLVNRLTSNSYAAILSGIGFAFCPYVFFEIGRIQLVATQWMPLSLLFLHRIADHGRFRDIVAFVLSYVLQVGTCLYYAMFLLPVLGFAWIWLIFKRNSGLQFWRRFVVVSFFGVAAIGAMIYPYLKQRDHFDLTRTEEYASAHDGKISYFFNVDTGNRFLTFLHHIPPGGGGSARGAREEIAFLGFSILILAIFGAIFPLIKTNIKDKRRLVGTTLNFITAISIVILASVGAATVFKTLLISIPIVIVTYYYWKYRVNSQSIYRYDQAMYLCLLPLAIAFYLGIEIFTVNGDSVRGLYYYLYRYVPGYDGIRKISRQAIVVTLIASILAGYGGKELLSSVKRPMIRNILFFLFFVTIIIEFVNVPVGLARVRSHAQASPAYKWLKNKGKPGIVAIVPFDDGIIEFRGHPGMALHNLYALYHEHRVINGRSSWFPPSTELYKKEIANFPKGSGTRLLELLRAKYLVVHTADLEQTRAKDIVNYLDTSTAFYKRAFNNGQDHIYELISTKSNLDKLDNTRVKSAVELHRWEVKVESNDNREDAKYAFDGDTKSRWCVRRDGEAKKWIEYRLRKSESLIAIDFTNFTHVLNAPFTYRVWVSKDLDGDDESNLTQEEKGIFLDNWNLVLEQKVMRLSEDQIFNPKNFIFRINMPQPVAIRRIRIEVLDDEPIFRWCINETKIWVKR